MVKAMTYAASGVDYGTLDPFKRAAQEAARHTAENIRDFNGNGFWEITASRGESAYVIGMREGKCDLVHVEEGLGTKNLVADAMYRLTGTSYYQYIAQDTVAMIVNDMATVGAQPLSVAMHVASGDSAWFDDAARSDDLIRGWAQACHLARCAWGPGETPTLKGVIVPGTVVLSGSAIGIITPLNHRIESKNIEEGDAIVLIESSGIHANGLTLARGIAERTDGLWRQVGNLFFPSRFPRKALPEGYLTRLPEGPMYGQMLLNPTLIYVGLVQDCLNAEIPIHYAVNITGHGWRKLMRAQEPFTYTIEQLPTQLPIFDLIQRHGPVDDVEAYGNFNMGAGFALYVRPDHVDTVVEIAAKNSFRAFRAGYITRSDQKKVVILPKNIEYTSKTLGVR